jgi:hypothetical protein
MAFGLSQMDVFGAAFIFAYFMGFFMGIEICDVVSYCKLTNHQLEGHCIALDYLATYTPMLGRCLAKRDRTDHKDSNLNSVYEPTNGCV